MLADCGSEDEGVESAEGCDVGGNVVSDAMGVGLHSADGIGVFFEVSVADVAHVTADAA